MVTMVRGNPPTASPPPSHTKRKHPPHVSPTQTVISSTVPPQTDSRNPCFIRLEFTTRHKGVDVNNDSLTTLVKKLLSHLFATDPTLEIYPINTWPKQNTTASSNTNHTEKTKQTTEKSPTLTTFDTVPSDFTVFDKYFQYTLHEHHPQQTNKTIVRFYSAGSKTTAELRNPATTAFLKANKMWVNSSNFPATVEFDSSADASPSSNTTCLSPKTTTFMSDTWSDTITTLATKIKLAIFRIDMQYLLSSQNNTYRQFLVPLLEKFDTLSTRIVKALAATHLSPTEALIDHKLATFRTDMQYLLWPQDTYRRLLVSLLPKFDSLSTHIEQVLAQRSRVPVDPPTHAPTTTLLPPYYHQNTYTDPRHASRDPDTTSVRSQSPVRPLPPHGYLSLDPLITYQQPPPPTHAPTTTLLPPYYHQNTYTDPRQPPPSRMDPPGNLPPRLRDG
jgi:hypothetical protein